MTGPYFDTGVALKLVVEEPLSSAARRFVEARSVAVPITSLVRLEMENALHALRFRGAITDEQLAGARTLVSDLLASGRFQTVNLSIDAVVAEALSLAGPIATTTGCRTLDLLHVVSARSLGASEFVSTDKRQLAAARMCGLRATELSADLAT